jgi:dTDP-glucose pyrophosphorylase
MCFAIQTGGDRKSPHRHFILSLVMLNIVVPMAGRGSRFANAGYKEPKPLIPVGGKPMIQWVIENVRPAQAHRFIFVCLAEHLEMYPEVPATLRRLCPGCEIVTVDRVTEGAACTVLLARKLIDNGDALMIANADQFVALKIDDYLAEMEKQRADGLIMTFWADDPKWSYCRMKPDGTVKEVVEKQVVSNEATVGIYNFREGHDFVRAADAMIAKNLRVNNEFYVAPAYNQLIEEGRKVVIAATGREYDGMYGLGTPADLKFFLTTEHFARGRLDAVG